MPWNPLVCYWTTVLQPAQKQTFFYGQETLRKREGSPLTTLAQSLASLLRHSVHYLEWRHNHKTHFTWTIEQPLDIKNFQSLPPDGIWTSDLEVICAAAILWSLQSVCVHPAEHFFCIKKQINLSLRLILFVSEVSTIFKCRETVWDYFYILSFKCQKKFFASIWLCFSLWKVKQVLLT